MQFPATETRVENCVYGQLIFPKTVHMEVRLRASLHTKGLTGVSHLTLAYMMGWTYVRSVGRSVGRSYDDVITKISRMDGLPYVLSNGAPRARAFGARGAPLISLEQRKIKFNLKSNLTCNILILG